MKHWVSLVLCGAAAAQQATHEHGAGAPVPLQPLAQQVRQLEEALNYLGQPFAATDVRRIHEAVANPDESAAVRALETVLDEQVLLNVDINPESRVKVEEGTAKPELVEAGTRLFLVKIVNNAHVRAPLVVQSPNSGDVFVQSNGNPAPAIELSPQDAKERWANITLYQRPPMRARLSGLALEYAILEVYSRDAGQRSAKISFNVGQGSQDIGFRNDVTVVFDAVPARRIALRIKDERGRPGIASFIIKDRLERIYPLPSKRLAPDFFFQPQIYRADGESVQLPQGYYTFEYTGGPEYVTHTREFAADTNELSFQLERWIDPASFGWYSGDHHVHAAGCSHYMNPTEGVQPEDMMRQILGEHLNIGSVLTWGPDYYYQKQFFSGKDHPLSKPDRLMHYDLEVSGFPSSHSGHIVLLNLKDQDFPRTKKLDDWPTWDLPIFRWAKSQGAVVGFAHSGWGLQVSGKELPSYQMPAFDGIGANEYIVDVTYPNTVDFISAVDTPYMWELNIWYHTLNVGFRTRIAGETDFPCIYDGKVGLGRTYAKIDTALTYEGWLRSLQSGRSYVSDGKTHLMDFKVNGTPAGGGAAGGEVRMSTARDVTVTLTAAAYLPVKANEAIRGRPLDEKPYWDVERARIGDTRDVPVEIVVNGSVAGRQAITADGKLHELRFEVPVNQSSWIAARVLPAAHTNPVFVIVGGNPVRASRASAEWCLNAVNQCWTQKAPRIRPTELSEAKQAYDHARVVYRGLINETTSAAENR